MSDTYREKAGYWTRRELPDGKTFPKRFLFLYFVTTLSRSAQREHETPPLDAELQGLLAADMLAEGNRTVYLALLHGDLQMAWSAGADTLREWGGVLNAFKICEPVPELDTAKQQRIFTNTLANVIHEMQRPVLLPWYEMMTGRRFGSEAAPVPYLVASPSPREELINPADVVANFLSQAHSGLEEYRHYDLKYTIDLCCGLN